MAKHEVKLLDIISYLKNHGFEKIDEKDPNWAFYYINLSYDGKPTNCMPYITFSEYRDVSKYDSLDEIRKTETIDDPSFNELLSDFVSDINTYEFEDDDGSIIEFIVVD